MKRILLLLGLIGGYAVAAQQKDLFDIEKHLQKKSIERTGKTTGFCYRIILIIINLYQKKIR
ncbi:MAG: hypothetical protein IPK57_11620 [Chitinophagaceae bacterium]|nr:hypothetical protein [Chitinophagaceae bacterium]